MKDIKIRLLTTIEDFNEMQIIEEAVWEMPPIPVHQTFTAASNGGIFLGAFLEDKLIGFLNSFPGYDYHTKTAYLCSHMMGILPEYRHLGLGKTLKLKQAEIAREYGYVKIVWTFDPLESRNAYLNIHKLGAVGAIYSPDYYGSLNDQLNQGLPTDRMIIEWDLVNVKKSIHANINDEHILLTQKNQSPSTLATFDTGVQKEFWLVGVPENFQEIKKNNFPLARKWRYATREIFNGLYAAGYQATDIIRAPETAQSYFVFTLKH